MPKSKNRRKNGKKPKKYNETPTGKPKSGSMLRREMALTFGAMAMSTKLPYQ